MGPHFLALALLLTLVGQNIITLGLIAKVVLVKQTKALENRLVMLLESHYTLERGLLLGGVIFISGLIVDGGLLLKWIAVGGGMADSVHLAFVASGAIAVGLNIIFSSFLVGMLVKK